MAAVTGKFGLWPRPAKKLAFVAISGHEFVTDFNISGSNTLNGEVLGIVVPVNATAFR
jgi:hypothetical protein